MMEEASSRWEDTYEVDMSASLWQGAGGAVASRNAGIKRQRIEYSTTGQATARLSGFLVLLQVQRQRLGGVDVLVSIDSYE